MPRFIRSACLTDYVSIARSFGLDPYRLLREADLDRSCLVDPEIKIPVGAVCRLLENSAHAARAEDFGLRMCEPRRLSGLGPLALAMHSVTGLLFTRRDLDAPLPGADPVMARHVKRYLDPMLARSHGTMSERVRQLVYEQLSTGRCAAEQAANSFGMDRRTLHRHLDRYGETFSSIVDEVRSDLALHYFEDHRRSLSEVALLLGFSAPSAFSRWFRNRFGCSPTSWRTAERSRTWLK